MCFEITLPLCFMITLSALIFLSGVLIVVVHLDVDILLLTLNDIGYIKMSLTYVLGDCDSFDEIIRLTLNYTHCIQMSSLHVSISHVFLH